MVPSGWKNVKFGELTSFSAFGPRFSSDLYSENGTIGTIRTTDLTGEGEINYQTIPYANLSEESFASHFLNDDDLLITRSGTCGVPCLFKKQHKPIVAGAFLIRFILKNTVHPEFVHSLLKSSNIQKDIQNLASGGVQKNLTGTNLKKLEINLPPLPEQKKIAEILSTWNKAITTTEQLLANSQQQKKALMQQLLTGKKRLHNHTGQPFTGEWEEVRLSSVLKVIGGNAFKSDDFCKDGIPLIRISNIKSDYSVNLENAALLPNIFFTEKFSVVFGDILIAMSGATTGKLGMYRSNNKALLNQRVGKLKIKKDITSNEYVFQLMKSPKIQYEILVDAVGGAQPNIGNKDIERIKVKIPHLEEQQKIAAVLTAADQEIDTLKQKLDHLKQEKKALMQQLLTGKRRVKI